MMSPIKSLIIVAVSIAFAAFFSGAETAVVSCSKVRLHHRVKEGSWRARVLESLLRYPEKFFSIVLVGTNISVIVCTAAATAFSVNIFGESGPLVATAVITPLLLIFGEVMPKSAFLYHADRVSVDVAPLLKIFSYVLWPLVAPATLLAVLLTRLTGSRSRRFNLLSTREELVYLYSRGRDEGLEKHKERLIIDRVFRFGDVRVGELMVPMERVVSLPGVALVEDAVAEANKHSYSRFPVLSADGRCVAGIVSLIDLLGLDGGEKLTSVMQPPHLVKEDEFAEKLLVMMRDEALHMAVVTDGTARARGILTLESILENIVGDIASEYE